MIFFNKHSNFSFESDCSYEGYVTALCDHEVKQQQYLVSATLLGAGWLTVCLWVGGWYKSQQESVPAFQWSERRGGIRKGYPVVDKSKTEGRGLLRIS